MDQLSNSMMKKHLQHYKSKIIILPFQSITGDIGEGGYLTGYSEEKVVII